MTERRHQFYDRKGQPQRDRRRKWQRLGPGQIVLYVLLAAMIVLYWRGSTNQGNNIQHNAAITCRNQQLGIAATQKLRVIISRAENLLTRPDAGDEHLRAAFDDYLRLTAAVHPPRTCPDDPNAK